ncbi:right-handed parallel beta-helix repeat-containing protein [Sciscionella sediminilitoris]|uniref:right-handed parallel beta-helix repeat-containing protein n=1 Tax=Sciscionella sediminilitoris TaxID=1445613 RepID=UPI0004DFB046|nr:right-handed parallel beta-helix repeat-containing protein [Sciscionella sp. SE31]
MINTGLRLLAAGSLPLLLATFAAPHAGAEQGGRTWYVSAEATAGQGSATAPFSSLAQAESASRAGDSIVVLPASSTAPPLDGGIALKPGQRLIGAGDPVVGASGGVPIPRITNTSGRLEGDAVRLAPGAQVRNLSITHPRRGGIYGVDTPGTVVTGNDVTETNTSCAQGFLIQSFTVPAGLPLRVPGLDLPFKITLNNGWAGIMVDGNRAQGTVRIEDNRVHDTACGDGIDVRASGTSSLHAKLYRNRVDHTRQGLLQLSNLAMGLQSTGKASLDAELVRNTQTDVGSGVVDSEGVFANMADQSRLSARIDHNTFRNGNGHFSANGLEYVTSNGKPSSDLTVTNSTFTDVPGDIIENYNLSTEGATQRMTLDNVRAAHSTFPAGLVYPVVPANFGSCVLSASLGSGNVTSLRMHRTTATDCTGDGVGIISTVGNKADGPNRNMSFDISDSQITGNEQANLRVLNIGDLGTLHGKVSNSNLADGGKGSADIEHTAGTIGDPELDFGGGGLGSSGGNCILGAAEPGVEVRGIHVDARHNWWGRPSAPAPGAVREQRGSIDTTGALSSAPRGTC